MANKNTQLHAAGKAKKDEFYTQLSDIEKEMRHYRKHFEGKFVLCLNNEFQFLPIYKLYFHNFNLLKSFKS